MSIQEGLKYLEMKILEARACLIQRIWGGRGSLAGNLVTVPKMNTDCKGTLLSGFESHKSADLLAMFCSFLGSNRFNSVHGRASGFVTDSGAVTIVYHSLLGGI